MQVEMEHNREFLFTEKDFKYLAQLAGTRAGINLSSSKRELIYGRLARRLRELGLKSYKQYCDRLKDGDEEELTNFINAITTNVTSFFRENHHFEFLEQNLLPELINNQNDVNKPRLRLWSAGCSSGEEPYSMAMVLQESIPDIRRWDAKILATDLDLNILDIASRGIYPLQRMQSVSLVRRKRWLSLGIGKNEGTGKVGNDIRQMVTFRQLNLTADWPMRGSFDAIFCRNVTIYFDKPTRIRLLNRFANLLSDDGHLFVGHSESLFGLTDRFRSVGRTIHQKVS
ncbi:MAG: protein-glutamate O-methyltransferase CheR [Proteobacteria bacterium]|nr:protein-glutamate O-methyltransferase CheR [Pseudomonadota bacterium]